VDQSKISTSGVSAGGAMTTQMHVAYSSVFMGVGVVAGGSYSFLVRLACMPDRLGLSVELLFLADRTIGRAYGTVCRLSSVCRRLSVTFCIMAKRCVLAKKCLKE